MRSHKLGQDGEAFATDLLRRRGYQIEEQNYRTRFGEVDIVAVDKGVVCFIEVKTRTEDGWDAFEAVHPRKQRNLIRVAQQYLLENFNTVDVNARFDVLAVYAASDGTLKGDLLKDAFGI